MTGDEIAATRALDSVFHAFADMTSRTESLLIDGDHVAQVLTIEGTNLVLVEIGVLKARPA